MDKQRFINEVNTRCEFNKYNHIFATDIAVSYTHLDVYKRQATGTIFASARPEATGKTIASGTDKSVPYERPLAAAES